MPNPAHDNGFDNGLEVTIAGDDGFELDVIEVETGFEVGTEAGGEAGGDSALIQALLNSHLAQSDRPPSEAQAPDEAEHGMLLHGMPLWPLLLIHRGRDGYVTFERKNPLAKADTKNWQNLFSVPVNELETRWNAILPWLGDDAYFSVNSMFRAARGKNKTEVVRTTGLPGVWREEVGLRYLNACYVDLDVERPNSQRTAQRLKWQDAVLRVEQLMGEGALPPVSMVARSGRGLYLFWLLAEAENPSQSAQPSLEMSIELPIPAQAWPDQIDLYKRINRAIGKTLTALAADTKAHDAARVLRVPDTWHSGCQQRAHYVACPNREQVPFYTLAQLAQFFEVGLNARSAANLSATGQPRRRTQKPGSAPNRSQGRLKLYRYRYEDLLLLEKQQDGWKKGRRRFFLHLAAMFLRGAGVSSARVLGEIKWMAKRCHPPYPSDANDTRLNTLVKEVFEGPLLSYTNAKLRLWLGVTPDIARGLKLRTIVPDEVAQERKPALSKRDLRRAWIVDYCQQHPLETLSCRGLQSVLQQAGFKVSHDTVSRDLRELKAQLTANSSPSQAMVDLEASVSEGSSPD